MQNRINQLFNNKTKDVLSVYFCAGYPRSENTIEVIQTLEKHGIDMLEIGIPFSDPMADGPVIQKAATQALHNGMTLRKLFSQLSEARPSVTIPLLLMGYLNPVMQYGIEAFFKECSRCGVDGCIIPDLPFDDYQKDVRPFAEKYDIKVVMLITPETSDERIRIIDANTDGFIYMVSSAAVTGAQKSFDAAKQSYFSRINAMQLRNPRMTGFGVSNRETFQAACKYAAGAIIGSRFVSLQAEYDKAEDAVIRLKEILSGD
jgi:tryptophan synthase alpha chain